MILSEPDLAYCAWLGAVLERLRRGEDGFPHDPEKAMTNQVTVDDDQKRSCYRRGPGVQREPLGKTYAQQKCPEILTPIYTEIMACVRGSHWENEFRGTLLVAPWPLPEVVLDDLLARDIQTDAIGHLWLSDSKLWSLADRVSEALLTLAKRRYAGPAYDEHQLEEVLHAFPVHEWMLRSLATMEPSCQARAAVVAKYIRALPNPQGLLKGRPDLIVEAWRLGG